MLKVLNIAQVIPIEGLPAENDIILKIYADLYQYYGIHNEFVKPVGNVPKCISVFRHSSKVLSELFNENKYFDKQYNIKIHFYKGTFPLINRLPFRTNFLLPLEFKIYSKALTDIVKAYKPNLIHAHSIEPEGLYALQLHKRFNLPYLLTIRGLFSGLYNTKRGKEILQQASGLTTPGYNLWSDFCTEYDIQLLPHGINDEWFTKKIKVPIPGLLRLVTVSRLQEWKNVQVVLKSIARLIDNGYKVKYDIMGDGEYRESLERLTKELNLNGSVRFHGYQSAENIRKIYEQCDIYVMLSYPETFGRSFFEAAAQGLYIIGAKNTGAYGHLSENEASFIDVDEFQLVEALKKIDAFEFDLKTSRLRMKIENFRNSEIIARYYSLISELISKTKK